MHSSFRKLLTFTRLARKYCRRKLHFSPTLELNSTYPNCIFSGIQPTGSVHLGNYLGAINQWKTFIKSEDKVILSIVDLHSITLPQDPNKLFDNVLEITATLLACGIDPQRCILFQQSTVPQHTELCWQLGCVTTMARLAHLPQYKEKSAKLKDIPLGLFMYPVLQAADLLLYKATQVPVGEDQLQHLQLAQDLARMFNKRYGQTFPMPHAVLPGEDVCRLKSLRDPNKKMSKSDTDPKSRIHLLDSPEEVLGKLKKAVTDFTSKVFYDPIQRPGVSNLISIHSAVTGKSVAQICDEAQHLDTGRYKVIVAEALINHLNPIRLEIIRLLNSPDYLIGILQNGAQQAETIAEQTAKEVRTRLGLRYRKGIRIDTLEALQ